MLSKFFPRIKALPLTERIQSRDAFVYLDRYQKIFGWAATDDGKWRIPYALWGICINLLLIFLLPISMLVSYIQMFKSFTAGEFLSSLEITVNMYGCVLKCLFIIWGYKGFQASNKVLDQLDLRCTSDEERSSVHRCVALGNMCFVFYHILFSGFVVGNWTAYILMGKHAWLMYLPGLDAERNYFTSSLCELLLMGGVVTMEQCTDVSPLAHMLMARCHITLLKDRLSKLRSDPNKNEEQHHEELRKCIQDHRLILEYVNKLRPIFSGTIFVQFLLIGIVLGLSMINVMFFSTFWTGLATVCFMFDVCLQTFPFCYVCNMIIEDCRELSERLFQSNWLAASRKYKSTLIYFLHNLQQPIVLTAGGVFPICMQTNLSQAEEKRRSMERYDFKRPRESKTVFKNPWEKPYALLVAISARQVGTFDEHFPNRKLWRRKEPSGAVPESKAATPDPEPQLSEKENENVSKVRGSLDGGDMPPRLTDRMYFVLDVEMVLNFEEPMDTRKKYLEELSKLVLPGTAGSMLYIPHIVIEEIDNFNMDQMLYATKVLTAERALQYLNKKLDSSFEIQAQSEAEEQDHLFPVCGTEDSIVNSCLQLQEEVPNMMLITYSASLRRAAKSMGIHVSSYPALREQYPEAFAALEEKREPLQELQVVEERSLY